MNLALLAKQGWRMVTRQTSLLFKILKGRYFRNGSFLNAKMGSNPSFGWRSLLEGRKIQEAENRAEKGHGKRPVEDNRRQSPELKRRSALDRIWAPDKAYSRADLPRGKPEEGARMLSGFHQADKGTGGVGHHIPVVRRFQGSKCVHFGGPGGKP
ncbi:hypothetical protein LIER_04863 [Lithospermum erythrorhizon]|uniref:Uncharacterized protein n=1 Tax=Lithospermum erythrorhizon TaxID=34254 RepID=A0AAV3NZ80_LITER